MECFCEGRNACARATYASGFFAVFTLLRHITRSVGKDVHVSLLLQQKIELVLLRLPCVSGLLPAQLWCFSFVLSTVRAALRLYSQLVAHYLGHHREWHASCVTLLPTVNQTISQLLTSVAIPEQGRSPFTSFSLLLQLILDGWGACADAATVDVAARLTG